METYIKKNKDRKMLEKDPNNKWYSEPKNVFIFFPLPRKSAIILVPMKPNTDAIAGWNKNKNIWLVCLRIK